MSVAETFHICRLLINCSNPRPSLRPFSHHWIALLLVCAFTLLSFTVQPVEAAVSPPAATSSYGSKFYTLHLERKRYAEAKADCESRTKIGYRSGKLPVILSSAENDAIYSLIQLRSHGGDAWIGGSDEGHPKSWRHNDLSTDDYEFYDENTGTSSFYTNWDSGQPNSASQHYLVMVSSGKWHDREDCQRHIYVCEFELLPRYSAPYAYEYLSALATFAQANALCQKRKYLGVTATRAVMKTDAHWDTVQNLLITELNVQENIWVGASDAAIPNRWVWDDGDHFSQLSTCQAPFVCRWSTSQPNNAGSSQDAGELFGNSDPSKAGKMNDMSSGTNDRVLCSYLLSGSTSAPLLVGTAQTLSPTSPPTSYVTVNNKRFEAFKHGSPLTIIQSMRNCAAHQFQGQSGHMATIFNQVENDAVKSIKETAGCLSYAWLGGTDNVAEGTFRWIQHPAQPTFWTGGSTRYTDIGYANWGTSEPNDGGIGGEDFVVMTSTGAWDDKATTDQYDCYICEWFVPTVGVLNRAHWMLHEVTQVTYDVAQKMCESTTLVNGTRGHLAVVLNAEDQQELNNVVRLSNSPGLWTSGEKISGAWYWRGRLEYPLYDTTCTQASTYCTPFTSPAGSGKRLLATTVYSPSGVNKWVTSQTFDTCTEGQYYPFACQFEGTATPTQSRTSSITGTTHSHSASQSTTTSHSATPTPSASTSVSRSKTFTQSPSLTSSTTPSHSPSRTLSQTSSPSRTATSRSTSPTLSRNTNSPSRSPSFTYSLSLVFTPSQSLLVTESDSFSITGSASSTLTDSPSEPTLSQSPSQGTRTTTASSTHSHSSSVSTSLIISPSHESVSASEPSNSLSVSTTRPTPYVTLLADPSVLLMSQVIAQPVVDDETITTATNASSSSFLTVRLFVATGHDEWAAIQKGANSVFAEGSCIDASYGAHLYPPMINTSSDDERPPLSVSSSAQDDGISSWHSGDYFHAMLSQFSVRYLGTVEAPMALINATNASSSLNDPPPIVTALEIRIPRAVPSGATLRAAVTRFDETSNTTTTSGTFLELHLTPHCFARGSWPRRPIRIFIQNDPEPPKRQLTPLQQGTDIATVVSGAVGSPTTALALQRINLIGAFCAEFEVEPLDWLDSPTGAAFTENRTRYHFGAIIMNPLLVIALMLITVIATAIYRLVAKQPLYSSLIRTRTVHLQLFGFVLMIQPTVGSCVIAMIYAFDAGIIFAASFVTLLFAGSASFVTLYFLKRHFHAKFVEKDAAQKFDGASSTLEQSAITARKGQHDSKTCKDRLPPCMLRVYLWFGWFTTPMGDWEHVPPSGDEGSSFLFRWLTTIDDYPKLFDPLFLDYRAPYQRFIGVEFICSVALCASSSLATGVGCEVGSPLLLLSCLLYFIAVWKCRPHAAPIDKAFSMTISLLQLLAAIAQLLLAFMTKSDGVREGLDWILIILSVLAMIRSVYDLAKMFERIAHTASKEKKPEAHEAKGHAQVMQFNQEGTLLTVHELEEIADEIAPPTARNSPNPEHRRAEIDLSFLHDARDNYVPPELMSLRNGDGGFAKDNEDDDDDMMLQRIADRQDGLLTSATVAESSSGATEQFAAWRRQREIEKGLRDANGQEIASKQPTVLSEARRMLDELLGSDADESEGNVDNDEGNADDSLEDGAEEGEEEEEEAEADPDEKEEGQSANVAGDDDDDDDDALLYDRKADGRITGEVEPGERNNSSIISKNESLLSAGHEDNNGSFGTTLSSKRSFVRNETVGAQQQPASPLDRLGASAPRELFRKPITPLPTNRQVMPYDDDSFLESDGEDVDDVLASLLGGAKPVVPMDANALL